MPRYLLVLVPLLAIAGTAWYWQATATEPRADDRLTLYGNVEIREARLAFNGSEHLAQVLVEEGDRVKGGQVLARLETERLRLALEQAQGVVEARQAQLDKLLAGTRPEEIAAAEAKVKAARARARAARDTWRRLQSLLKRKLAAPEEVEVARANAEAAEAELDAAQQNLRLLRTGPRAEDIAAAASSARGPPWRWPPNTWPTRCSRRPSMAWCATAWRSRASSSPPRTRCLAWRESRPCGCAAICRSPIWGG